jgi:4-hydroxy-3-polyprenylbenzoate decarboxylase
LKAFHSKKVIFYLKRGGVKMARQEIRSLRSTLEWFKKEGLLLETNREVDPKLEVAAIQKRLDEGLPILFNKVKGYPNSRIAINVLGSEKILSKAFGHDDRRSFKSKIHESILQPTPPRIVEKAPCQEVVIDKNIDVWPVIPMIQHTPSDPGRTLGAGKTVASPKQFWGGWHISCNRMSFREDLMWKDHSTFQISPGSHTDQIATAFYKKEPIPLSINIGIPLAATLMAGSGFMYVILARGCDELGIAGAIQGFPLEMVKCKTIDAYAIAEAEYVLEGYLDTTKKVWESPLAEKDQKQGVYPFHPEWSGYMGKAYQTYQFTVTAITHRKERPIYDPPIVHAYESHNIDVLCREVCFFELAERVSPGFCIDTHIPLSLTDWGGIVFQVKKRRARDDGYPKNILAAALSCSLGARFAMVVDPDINIYSTDDLLWAMATRVDAREDIAIVAQGGIGQTFQPAERSSAGAKEWTQSNIKFGGGIGIDATIPYQYKDAFKRASYPIEVVNLKDWFTEEEIEKSKSFQGAYAKWLSESGH